MASFPMQTKIKIKRMGCKLLSVKRLKNIEEEEEEHTLYGKKRENQRERNEK